MKAACLRVGPMYTYPHQSDRLFRRATAGTGNSGDRNPYIGTHSVANSRRHLKRHLLTHCSVALDVLGAYTQRFHLHVVVVGDDAAEKNIARPRNARDSLSQHPAGAALSDRELEPQGAESLEHDRREIRVILSISVRRYPAPQFQNCFLYEFFRPGTWESLRRDAKIYAGDSRQEGEGERSQLRAGLTQEIRSQHLRDRRFRDPGRAQSPGEHYALSTLCARLDGRQYFLGQHSAHLARNTRNHRNPPALFVLEPDSGRRAVTVCENPRALGNLGLRAVGRGIIAVGKSRSPPLLERARDPFVQIHLAIEDFGDRRLGEIVARRSESTGRDHGAGPVESLAHRARNLLGLVAHGGAANDLNAGRSEDTRYVRCVRIYREAQEELVTDRDQLDLHRAQKANTPAYRRR